MKVVVLFVNALLDRGLFQVQLLLGLAVELPACTDVLQAVSFDFRKVFLVMMLKVIQFHFMWVFSIGKNTGHKVWFQEFLISLQIDRIRCGSECGSNLMLIHFISLSLGGL